MKHDELSEQQIPDDLKNAYELDKQHLAAICEWHMKNEEWVRSPMILSDLIERIAKAESTVAELEAKIAQARREALEPDMFWDADDSDRCEDSIREIVYERGLEVVEVMTASRGETVFAFLTGDDESEPEIVHVFNTKEEAEAAIRALIAKEPANPREEVAKETK